MKVVEDEVHAPARATRIGEVEGTVGSHAVGVLDSPGQPLGLLGLGKAA